MAKSHRRTFQTSWLMDPEFSSWVERGTDSERASCKLCKRDFNISAMGRRALSSHAVSKRHRDLTNDINEKTQSRLQLIAQSSSKGSNSISSVDAEVRLLFFIVEHNIPMSVLDHSGVIQKMCPDSKIAAQIAMKRTKGAYILNDGLGPVLKATLHDQIKEKPFSLLIDESNEMGHRKFLEIVISFLDDSGKLTLTHFDLCEISDGKAETIFNCVMKRLEIANLPLCNLISCMTDSPAVMIGQKKGFLTLLKNVVPHIVDVGRCSLHHVANAVKYACDTLESLVEDFADDVFHYFHYTSRWTSYSGVVSLLDLPQHKFLRRVETRWVQILEVSSRLLEQLPALRKYFLETLPRERKGDLNNACVIRIRTSLQNPMLEIHLNFLKSSLVTANKFEKHFQKDSCEIANLYNKLRELYKEVLSLFVKEEVILKSSKYSEIPTDRKNQCEDKSLFVGERTTELIKILLLNGQKKKVDIFYCQVRLFYETFSAKLRSYLPLHNTFIRTVRVLNPQNEFSLDTSIVLLTNLCKLFPTLLTNEDRDGINLEWRTFRLQTTPHDDLDMNTVEFWNKRREKFPTIWKLAEVVLCVPHGNSTTERIFSALQDNFTKKRNRLEELTIDSLLHVKSMLSRMGVTCESIEVSSEMRSAAQAARHEYGVRLKIQRQIEEEEQARTRELEDVQKRLMEEEERRRHNEAVSKVESDLAEKRKSLEKQERVLKNTLVEYQKAMEKLSENRKAIEVEEIDLKKKKESLMRRSIISTLPRIPRIQTDDEDEALSDCVQLVELEVKADEEEEEDEEEMALCPADVMAERLVAAGSGGVAAVAAIHSSTSGASRANWPPSVDRPMSPETECPPCVDMDDAPDRDRSPRPVSRDERLRTASYITDAIMRRRVAHRLLRKIRFLVDQCAVRCGQQIAVVTASPGKGGTRSRSTASNLPMGHEMLSVATDAHNGLGKEHSQEAFVCRVVGTEPLSTALRQHADVCMSTFTNHLQREQSAQKSTATASSISLFGHDYEASMPPPPPPVTSNLNGFALPLLQVDGIPTTLEMMTQSDLRVFIPFMLKSALNRGKPFWGKPRFKPVWWPDHVLPWANIKIDSRTPKQKMVCESWTDALREMVRTCYRHHGLEHLLETSFEPDGKRLVCATSGRQRNDSWLSPSAEAETFVHVDDHLLGDAPGTDLLLPASVCHEESSVVERQHRSPTVIVPTTILFDLKLRPGVPTITTVTSPP